MIHLIRCLRESAPDAGEAHEELADSLQKALDSYVSPPEQDRAVNSNNKEDGNEFVMIDPASALIFERHGVGRSMDFRNPSKYTIRQGTGYHWMNVMTLFCHHIKLASFPDQRESGSYHTKCIMLYL